MIIKKSLSKILCSFMAIIIFLMTFSVVFSFNLDEVMAVGGSIEVVVGNNDYSAQTNMVVKWTLGTDLTCNMKWTFNFDQAIVDATLTDNDIAAVYLEGGYSNAYTMLNGSATSTKINLVRYTDPSCVTISAGETIILYFGPSDSPGNYVTGEPDYFNPLATRVFTNPASGPKVNLNTTSSYAPLAGDTGFYLLGNLTDEGDIAMEGIIIPYIQMIINGDAESNVVANGNQYVYDSDQITISTNTTMNYVLRYRSTDMVKIDDPLVVIPPASQHPLSSSGSGEWGIHLEYVNGTGTIPLINSWYDGQFSMFRTNDYMLIPLLTMTSGPSTATYNLFTDYDNSLLSGAGDYQATITLNLYAEF